MRINTNLDAFTAQRNLSVTSMSYSKSVQKLSSGLRINSAADDAAGLSISEKLRAQIKGLAQAQRNAQDGISLIQTAEGALNETHSILQRMRELGVQGANGTLSTDDKTAIVSELTALGKEVDRISTVTDFNGTKLLSGGASSAVAAAVGAVTKSNATGDAGTAAGTYTGTTNLSYVVKATAVSATGATSLGSVTKSNASGDTLATGGTFTGTTSLSYKVKTTAVSAATVGAVTTPGTDDVGVVSGTYTGTAVAAYSVKATALATTTSAMDLSGAVATTAVVSGNLTTSIASGSYAVKVKTQSAGAATVVNFSTDGGATYGADIAISGGAFALTNGQSITLGGTNAALDVVKFTAANHATQVQVSTDGGSTYGSNIAVSASAAALGNGLTLTYTPNAAKGEALNDAHTFAATPTMTSKVQYSTDGGTTYNGTDLTVTGTTSTTLNNGVTVAFANTAGSAVNDTFSFAATAGTPSHVTKLQYSTDGGTTYNGTDVTVSTTTPAALNNGVTFAFANTAASALNDTFSFTASAATTAVAAKSVDLQIGANTSTAEKLTVNISASGSGNIGAVAGVGGAATLSAAITTVSTSLTSADFLHLVDSVDSAQKDVSKIRGDLGANQNRLEHTIANLGVSQENLTASESRIRDVDMAAEMVNFTKTGILQQAGQAILAQANQSSSGVMALLR
jgi:flagellin